MCIRTLISKYFSACKRLHISWHWPFLPMPRPWQCMSNLPATSLDTLENSKAPRSCEGMRRFGSRLVLTLWKHVLMTVFTWCASIFWDHKKRVQDGHQVSLFKKQQPWFVHFATPDTLRCHCVGCREYVSYQRPCFPSSFVVLFRSRRSVRELNLEVLVAVLCLLVSGRTHQ